MSDDLRPIPQDPDAAEVTVRFDLASDDWMLTVGGEYQTAAAEVWKADGTNWQRVILLEWPARRNHDHSPDADQIVRLMMSPEDALGLARIIAETSAWLRSLTRGEN